MKRNDYQKPTIHVVRIQQRQLLLQHSDPEHGGQQARKFNFDWNDSDE